MVLPKRSCLCASVRSSDWFGARFSFRWFGNFIQMVLEKSVRIFLIIVSFHSFRAQSLRFLCSGLFTFYALPWSWDCLMWRCMLWSISNTFILSKLLNSSRKCRCSLSGTSYFDLGRYGIDTFGPKDHSRTFKSPQWSLWTLVDRPHVKI